MLLCHRGMDGPSSLKNYTRVTPIFDPDYFGAPPLPRPPPAELPLIQYRTLRPFADPELFWVMERGEWLWV